MNLTKTFWTFTIFLLCIPSPSFAQDRNSLRDRAVASIKKTEHQWELDKNEVLDSSAAAGFDVVYLGWAFDESRAVVLIQVHPTPESAARDILILSVALTARSEGRFWRSKLRI